MSYPFYIDETNEVSGPVVRWVSNNAIPFEDMLQRFVLSGDITDTEMVNSLVQRKIEDKAAIEAYVASRQKYGYTDEEKFEMRAAFGDEEVVDVFTGKTITLQEIYYG